MIARFTSIASSRFIRNFFSKFVQHARVHEDHVLTEVQSLEHCLNVSAFGWAATVSILVGVLFWQVQESRGVKDSTLGVCANREICLSRNTGNGAIVPHNNLVVAICEAAAPFSGPCLVRSACFRWRKSFTINICSWREQFRENSRLSPPQIHRAW